MCPQNVAQVVLVLSGGVAVKVCCASCRTLESIHFVPGLLKVESVTAQSPASIAGLQVGDEVVSFQGVVKSQKVWNGGYGFDGDLDYAEWKVSRDPVENAND